MDKKIAGLAAALAAFGAVSADATTETAMAAPELLRAQSFADLLDPIPNAVALLRAIDSAKSTGSEGVAQPEVRMAQDDEHHHHHHHRYYRKPYAPPRRYVPPRRYYEHHHHHHHHYENDD